MKRFYTFVIVAVLFCSWLNFANAQEVFIPDANLEAAIREALSLAPNTPITRQDMQRLTELTAMQGLEPLPLDRQIKNLTGLEQATQLEYINFSGNQIQNIGPLAGLTKLKQLYLGWNQIRDVSPLAGLTQLEELILQNNQIWDVSPLARLTQLKLLSAWNNQVSDVRPLAGLTQLENLSLGINQIQDVRPLAQMTQLVSLDLRNNLIRDVSPLRGLTELTQLWLSENPIQDTSPLADLTKLVEVDVEISAPSSDIDEPRTVRMFYFLPNDRPYNADLVQRMKAEIRSIQTFYAEQMEASGHGSKTFRYETDDQGEPMVHRVDGEHPERNYGHGLMLHEIGQIFDLNANIYLVVLDNSWNSVDGAGGRGRSDGKNSGYALIPGGFHWTSAAHELGHAFGLEHDFRDNAFLMAYGQPRQLSPCAAGFLSVHPYFDPNIPIENSGSQPTIELISPQVYPARSENIPVRLKVSDLDGLHQIFLFVKTQAPHFSVGALELKACRELAGEKETLVEFDYDGVIPSDGATSLSNPDVHPIYVRSVDKKGNVGQGEFSLFEASTRRSVIPIEQRVGSVYSVAFSHDSSILAVALGTLRIKLWDTMTGEDIGTLFGHQDRIGSVTFSPNEAVLASGSWDSTVKLWDVETQTEIATLKHTKKNSGRINSVAFSPDGSILASGAGDDRSDPPEYTIKLWDVATQTEIVTLKGHTYSVQSVAFSPDGATLASGGFDAKIMLWDVATHTEIATLPEPTNNAVTSVAFSPDGKILASGGFNHEVNLWNIATETVIASLPGHINIVRSVAFSPDGKILASADQDGKIRLWDVATATEITSLAGHTSWLFSAVFSPDGTTLASAAGHSGEGDYTIILWDTSELANLRLPTLSDLKISEIMVASNGGQLPQWIELHNPSSTHPVNLEGWRLEIQNRRSTNFSGRINTALTFKEKVIEPQETLLIISKRGRSSNHFPDEQIYELSTLHPNLQDMVLSEEGFYLKLSNAADELIDEVGNLDGKRNTDDKPAWDLPRIITKDGVRTSMIRRHIYGVPVLGTQASGWISAVNTNLAISTTTYYGHPNDIGAPGIESGGALPVQLSVFRAKLTDTGVALRWITESEVDNAGFNILRSETRDGEFKIVNPTMIPGAGTTSERHTYTWTDTTAKLNVVYYYRIEDVSHTGVRKQLATVRMRGYVSAVGKFTTKWGDLKLQE